MGRKNKDVYDEPYKKGQCYDHFLPRLDFKPEWMIDCGPANAYEAMTVYNRWNDVKFLLLEPSPISFEAALKNLPPGGTLLEAAVWDRDTYVDLYYPEDLLHSNLFGTHENAIVEDTHGLGFDTSDVSKVQARSLDSLDNEYGPFSKAILWLDVEGAERRALKGASRLLESGAIWAINLENRPDFAAEIDQLLIPRGFEKLYTYFECASVRDEVWLLKTRVKTS